MGLYIVPYISIEYPIRERSGIIYSSIYQYRVPNNRKDSGVGLYIVPYISIEYPITERAVEWDYI